MAPLETKVIFQATIFHFHDCGSIAYLIWLSIEIPGWCSTPTYLLICSSFNRENGYPLLITVLQIRPRMKALQSNRLETEQIPRVHGPKRSQIPQQTRWNQGRGKRTLLGGASMTCKWLGTPIYKP